MNILTVVQSDLDRRFFIDCPVNTVMEGEKCLRMEIPQELAKYMQHLQHENANLRNELKNLRRAQLRNC